MPALARLAVDHACDLLDAHSAALYWWDADDAVLRRLVDNRAAPQVVMPTLQPGESAAGLAFQRREPSIVEDYAAWPGAAPWSVAIGSKAVLVVPIMVGDRALGTLGVRGLTPRRFEPAHVRLLVPLAAHVGTPLEAARLYAESEARRRESEALAEIARRGAAEPAVDQRIELIAEQACQLGGADYAGIALVEPDGTPRWRGPWGIRSEVWRSAVPKRSWNGTAGDRGATNERGGTPGRRSGDSQLARP